MGRCILARRPWIHQFLSSRKFLCPSIWCNAISRRHKAWPQQSQNEYEYKFAPWNRVKKHETRHFVLIYFRKLKSSRDRVVTRNVPLQRNFGVLTKKLVVSHRLGSQSLGRVTASMVVPTSAHPCSLQLICSELDRRQNVLFYTWNRSFFHLRALCMKHTLVLSIYVGTKYPHSIDWSLQHSIFCLSAGRFCTVVQVRFSPFQAKKIQMQFSGSCILSVYFKRNTTFLFLCLLWKVTSKVQVIRE